MAESTVTRVQINGEEATVDAVRIPAQLNYGHFTVMRVDVGAVRGLDLHLARLGDATTELFGRALDLERTREWMRRIVGGSVETLSLRVQVYSRHFDRDRPLRPVQPDVLMMAAPVRRLTVAPLEVGSARYARELPHIKHVGTFGLFHQKRLAQARGFDDVVFVDADGAVSEGSIWNIGFMRAGGVAWPDAPALPGISAQLLRRGLASRGLPSTAMRVTLRDLATFDGAFFTNASHAVVPIARIDEVAFALEPTTVAQLQACHDANPLQPI